MIIELYLDNTSDEAQALKGVAEAASKRFNKEYSPADVVMAAIQRWIKNRTITDTNFPDSDDPNVTIVEIK